MDAIRQTHDRRVEHALRDQLETLEQQLAWCSSRGAALNRMDRRIGDHCGEKYLIFDGKPHRALYIVDDEFVVFYTVIRNRPERQNTAITALRNNSEQVLRDARSFAREQLKNAENP